MNSRFYPVDKPMNQMTFEEKIAKFKRDIADNTEDSAHSRMYVKRLTEQMEECKERHRQAQQLGH